MTLIIDENPYILHGYFIYIKGMRGKRFEADNEDQILLAIAHHFRPEGTDPRHWSKEGIEDCPLCP